jgi:hypothetical protein
MRCALVIALLLTHAGLLLGGLRWNFVTADEPGHFAAGVSYWDTGTFALYRVNPPLTRALAVLPALAARPQRDYRRWLDDPGSRSESWVGRDFAAANAARYLDLLHLARLAGVAWSLLGGYLIYRWARELYGARAGCLALTLWCFGPNVLAHAPLLTPDVPAAVAGLAATYVYWHYLRSPSWTRAFCAGLLLGGAELTKFTLLVLYAVWPFLWLLYQRRRRDVPGRAVRLGPAAGQLGLILVLSVYVINLGYGFQGSCRRLGDYRFVSHFLGGELPTGPDSHTSAGWGNRFRESWLGSVGVPLPQDYLCGIDEQRRDFEAGWPSYRAGGWHEYGCWYYYLYALAVKVPLGTWGLVLGGLVLTLARYRGGERGLDELTLWLPAVAVLGLVSSQTGMNNHMRYLLPLFPFVVISTGKLACTWGHRHGKAGLAGVALVSWVVGSSLVTYPHSLSYFNEASGGPENGPAHLVDSNLDWGQDLLFLKDWLEEHPQARPLGLAYFGAADPRSVGIDFRLPAWGPGGLTPEEATSSPGPGPHPDYYAVSVNYVRGMSFPAPDGRGGWRLVPFHAYEYFRHFRPVARAGYSILIYHITPAEANAVRQRLTTSPERDRGAGILPAATRAGKMPAPRSTSPCRFP